MTSNPRQSDRSTPTSVEAMSTQATEVACPLASIVTSHFPARGKMPPVKYTWLVRPRVATTRWMMALLLTLFAMVVSSSTLARSRASSEVKKSWLAANDAWQRLAVAATEANKKIVEQERQAHLRREAKAKGEAEDLGKLMTAVTVTIHQKAGEADQLFGSVTAQDISNALDKKGYTIDRRKVHLDEPIKMLGDFKVSVKLHREVSVELPVHVVKED